tara:strand:+ start:9756 stop:11798 length:2043 start_codon:yes stop_codon:yes gene_type:complete
MSSSLTTHADSLTTPDTLIWDDQGQPLSRRFGDFYFSRVNGLEETEYVSLQHNQLTARWQSLGPEQHFTIGETGFGTGLNFLATWQRWRQQAKSNPDLHFISAERYPLSPHDLSQALLLWPELAELAESLLEQYPLACQGFHRLIFDQGRVQLTLIFDDACHAFTHFDHPVDAWFLDGFSPAKNSEMWDAQLFTAIAQCSHQRTTFSTFTAASSVRKGLEAAGFEVNKAAGFSKKREMLYGHYREKLKQPSNRPWYARPSSLPIATNVALTTTTPRSVSIIGAGLAGASTAFALAERGCQVQLFERGAQPGCGASGNPQGVLYSKLPAQPTIHSRIHLTGYLYSLRLLQRLQKQGQLKQDGHWSPCGVIQLALDEKEAEKQRKLVTSGRYPAALVQAIDVENASRLAGYPLTAGGLLFPQGGWVSPADLCRQLLSHPNIHCHFNQPIDRIHFDPEQQHWQLHGPAGKLIHQTPQLVVANAHEANKFKQLTALPLKPIRGQTSAVYAPSSGLKTVLCGNGYIAPASNQQYCFGASFDLNDLDTRVREEDHLLNLEHIRQISPALAQQLSPQLAAARGRVGFRCAAPDYLPIVGAIADSSAFIRDYAELGKDASARCNTPATHIPGLFVNLAHGSKGMVTAPLAGRVLADMLLNEPPAIESELLQALNPARFIIKKIIKGTV